MVSLAVASAHGVTSRDGVRHGPDGQGLRRGTDLWRGRKACIVCQHGLVEQGRFSREDFSGKSLGGGRLYIIIKDI